MNEKEQQVKQALEILSPDIRSAIFKITTLSAIAANLPDRGMGFDRILAKTPLLPVPLPLLGTKRRTARYTHLYYKDHAVQVEAADEIDALSSRIHNPSHLQQWSHRAKILRVIQSVIRLEEVEYFMVGKASVQEKDHPHAHSAMVNRFGDKYKKCGYSHMIGLCVLDGQIHAAAEAIVLGMEAFLHAIYANHAKYDAALSNAQSGALSQSPSTAYFTLYLAIKIKKN